MEGNSNKPALLLQLLVVFLVFSYLLSSSSAAPLSRSLKMVNDEAAFAQEFADQQSLMEEEEEEEDANNYREMLEVESTGDYRPGANTHHDPPPPKR
ncbi:hypothetical protein BVC80_1321g75 [Macleaya cordata]|uniref:Uncharacterized protein n=1 Tax=Macleaya cordata TaxID=56857 RepID=A0A200Q0E8_MACCD|nr:hypothetical protein BVC80_1321g75 [Macleaya cordata]